MAWGGKSRWLLASAGFLLAVAALPLPAQQKPLSLSGEVRTGFYQGSYRDSGTSEFSALPFNVRLDLSGYVGHPDFLSFRLQPILSAGTQPRQDGLLGGNGLSLSASFLRRRAFPVTIHYTNLWSESLEFGEYNQIAGLRSASHTTTFGISSDVRLPHLPVISLHFQNSRSRQTPALAGVPETQTDTTSYGLSAKEEVWGWQLSGDLQVRRWATDSLNLLRSGLGITSNERDTNLKRISARRSLWEGTSLSLDAEQQSEQGTFANQRNDQDSRYLGASLFSHWSPRWEGSFSLAWFSSTSNLTLRQALENLTGEEATRPGAASGLALLPLANKFSAASYGGTIRFRASRDWQVFGGTASRRQETPRTQDGLATLEVADTFGHNGGLSFNHQFSWGNVAAQYSLRLTQTGLSGVSPETQTGDRVGHGVSLRVSRGTLDGLEIAGSFNQRQESSLGDGTGNSTFRALDFALGRRIRNLVVRGSLGALRSSLTFVNEYRTEGLTYGASVEHSRFRLSYSRDANDGISVFPLLLSGSPTAADRLGPADFLLGSAVTAFRVQKISFQANPWRNLQLLASWFAGTQSFTNQGKNEYEYFEVTAGYRFRLLTLEARYSRNEETFLGLRGIERGRFYIRVSRPFTLF